MENMNIERLLMEMGIAASDATNVKPANMTAFLEEKGIHDYGIHSYVDENGIYFCAEWTKDGKYHQHLICREHI